MNCFVNDDVKFCNNNPADSVFLYDSRPGSVFDVCNAVQPSLIGASARLSSANSSWMQKITDARWMILASVFSAFLVTLFFLLISRPLMGIIIWIQLGIAIIFCILLSVLFFLIAFVDNTETLKKQGATAQAIEAYNNIRQYKWWFFSFGLVLSLVALCLLVYVIMKCKKISSNVEILRVNFTQPVR